MTGYTVRNTPADSEPFHVCRGADKAPVFKAKTVDEAFDWIEADKAKTTPVDELDLYGWPERDDAPDRQRIEQGGELHEVYDVLDRLPEGLK